MRKFGILLCLILFIYQTLSAREGMWVPTLLGKNIEEMKQMGFKLSAEDIYSINHASMKDAVVIFGRGCTGELVSNEGLLITNHHCGYSVIQEHSSVEHDYLTDGFWAKSKEEELPNPNLTVSFLERMEDVTTQVLAGTNDLEKDKIQQKISENIKELEKAASDSGQFQTVVKPLFYGNQYFLYVYLVYKDVRLVGTPPSAIGKFGGDTDNWMWPRHTGDFSMFRIYADKDNKPAKYSKDNVPFRPKKFFPISMKGVQPNDFTLTFGYPGTTTEYLPSNAVELVMDQSDPDKIRIRDKKLEILNSAMEADKKVRIQYSAKYARISNAWKKWQGEILGLKRLNVVGKKEEFEREFTKWLKGDQNRNQKYGHILPQFDSLYSKIKPLERARDFKNEIVDGGCDVLDLADILDLSAKAMLLIDAPKKDSLSMKLLEEMENHFKDYDFATDRKMFISLLRIYRQGLEPRFLPSEFVKMMDSSDDEKLAKLYSRSVFTDIRKTKNMVRQMPRKGISTVKNDPVFKLFDMLKSHYLKTVSKEYADLSDQIKENQRLYMAGILEMQSDQMLYPDANSTLRVSYGKVEGFYPRDGVYYDYFTTLDGIIQKDNPEIYDYNIPQKLREIFREKDYGRYEVNGTVPVCFIASNHTTGGNSGSPVVNANGELVGINFDRCWEGTMSDIMYDPDRCRNIMLDIRYVLFIVDKFAGAGYLLDEMKIL